MRNSITATLLVLTLATTAFAEEAGGGPPPGVDDYRWALFTSCSLVFIAMAVYLVLTHRSGAKLDDDIAHLESRISGLEK